MNRNIEIENLVTENDIRNWLKLKQNIGMSGYIAFVAAAQKHKKVKLLNRNIDLERILAWVSTLQSSTLK